MSVTVNSPAAGFPTTTADRSSTPLNVSNQVSGILPIANGGTGTVTGFAGSTVLTTQVSGILPIANGGTGTTTGVAAGSSDLTTRFSGILPIANGGTGTAIGIAGSSSLTTQVSGILPEANGGTGTSSSLVTAWVAYTPIVTGATATNKNFRSRREGSDLIVVGYFNVGALTGSNFNFSLGFNGSNGNVTAASWIGSSMVVGQWVKDQASATAGPSLLLVVNSNLLNVGFTAFNPGSIANLLVQPGNFVISTNSNAAVWAQIPIQGW